MTKKGTTKLVEKIWVRIGRMRERHKGVSGRYNLNVISDNGKTTAITWEKSAAKSPENSQCGVYFIRTNLIETSEERLWQVYNLVREVESTFRCLKSDLLIRPIYHQTDQRIEGHIYQNILSYQIVNAIRFQLKIVGIHLDWTNIVRILKTQTLNEISIPTRTKNLVIIKPSKPIADVQNIYKALAIPIILKSKKKYVKYH